MVLPHLAHEEAECLPLCRAYFTPAEIMAETEKFIKKAPPAETGSFIHASKCRLGAHSQCTIVLVVITVDTRIDDIGLHCIVLYCNLLLTCPIPIPIPFPSSWSFDYNLGLVCDAFEGTVGVDRFRKEFMKQEKIPFFVWYLVFMWCLGHFERDFLAPVDALKSSKPPKRM